MVNDRLAWLHHVSEVHGTDGQTGAALNARPTRGSRGWGRFVRVSLPADDSVVIQTPEPTRTTIACSRCRKQKVGSLGQGQRRTWLTGFPDPMRRLSGREMRKLQEDG